RAERGGAEAAKRGDNESGWQRADHFHGSPPPSTRLPTPTCPSYSKSGTRRDAALARRKAGPVPVTSWRDRRSGGGRFVESIRCLSGGSVRWRGKAGQASAAEGGLTRSDSRTIRKDSDRRYSGNRVPRPAAVACARTS